MEEMRIPERVSTSRLSRTPFAHGQGKAVEGIHAGALERKIRLFNIGPQPNGANWLLVRSQFSRAGSECEFVSFAVSIVSPDPKSVFRTILTRRDGRSPADPHTL